MDGSAGERLCFSGLGWVDPRADLFVPSSYSTESCCDFLPPSIG